MSHDLVHSVLLIHAAATWFMVGLIWFVQLVHYPLMAKVSPPAFVDYARAHQRRTSFIVLPVMLIELVTAGLVVWASDGTDIPLWLALLGLGLLAVIWLSTFALQVPLHHHLAKGFDATACRRLVGTNWLRTAAWSARGVLALMMLP